MTVQVVVLGAGYAGAGAIKTLQSALGVDTHLTWIADVDYHLVLHESHRVIRDASVREDITIPVEEIADPATTFVEDRVTGLDSDERSIHLESGESVEYDYVLVALGSDTAYYGIPGLEANAHTLKSLSDALDIHEAIGSLSERATRGEPGRVVIGGAGLSGIQTAGEVAEFRDIHRAPLEIHLVEALEEIFPGNDPGLQAALRDLLEAAGVHIHTNDPITEVDEGTIHLADGEPIEFDELVWTGGIAGRDELASCGLDAQHNRIEADETFQTSDERVFAIGDSAIVAQGEGVAPPTAQSAWQAAELVGENIARSIEGRPLQTWEFDDKGTCISVGEDAVAHDIKPAMGIGLPLKTFGGVPAKTLKKMIAARWIASITSWNRARKAWPSL